MDYKESDVETAFIKYCEDGTNYPWFHVIGRQVPLPLGIVDVLATHQDPGAFQPVVIEVKKGKIDLAACGQLLGYMEQVNSLIYWRAADSLWSIADYKEASSCIGVLVGSDIDERARRIPLSGENFEFYKYELIDGKFSFSSNPDWFDHDVSLDKRMVSLIESVVYFQKERFIRTLDPMANQCDERPANTAWDWSMTMEYMHATKHLK